MLKRHGADKTGGGPLHKEVSPVEEKITKLFEDTPLFMSLDGFETGAKKNVFMRQVWACFCLCMMAELHNSLPVTLLAIFLTSQKHTKKHFFY